MDVIVGGGKYGVEAAKFLMDEGRDFIVLDPDPNCMAVRELKAKYEQGGIEKLIDLVEKVDPEYIFPTAPIHVAAEAVKLKYNLNVWNEVINCILAGLPQKIVLSAGRGGIVVTYNRDKDCIQNCSAPDVCPVTKIKKPCPMYELVKFAYPEGFVLVSQQLKPGLGAIRGEDFKEFLNWSKDKDKFVVATACRCHGVITALRR